MKVKHWTTVKRKRKFGFRSRMSTKKGKLLIKNRRAKGRTRLVLA